YGGLDSPDTNFGLQRKVSDHTEMEYLYHSSPTAKITTVHSKIAVRYVKHKDPIWNTPISWAELNYRRDLLFIRDKTYSFGTIPVQLIDFNELKPGFANITNYGGWRMQYVMEGVLSSSGITVDGWNSVEKGWSSTGATHLFLTAVEFQSNHSNSSGL